MPFDHRWTVICKESSLDQETNNISLFKVLEQLNVNLNKEDFAKLKGLKPGQSIGVPLEFEVVTVWDKKGKKEESANVRVMIFDPNGKELASNDHLIKLQADKRRLRVNNKIKGFPLTVSGDYVLVVKLMEKGAGEYKPVVHYPIEVTITQSPGS